MFTDSKEVQLKATCNAETKPFKQQPVTKCEKSCNQSTLKKNTKYTADSFKIVNSIPDDDSDVTDAFDSDNEETKNMDYVPKMTDDGFKVVKSIPEDDSDVSDAFDSEYDDEEHMDHTPIFTDDGFKISKSVPKDDSDVSDAFDSDYEDEESESLGKNIQATQPKLLKSDSNNEGKGVDLVPQIPSKEKKKNHIPFWDDSVSAKVSTSSQNQQSNSREQTILDIDIKPNAKLFVKDFKLDQNYLPFTPEELENFLLSKTIQRRKEIKLCLKNGFGSCYEEFETPQERERRELSRLPQPEQQTKCDVFYKKDKISGKIVTVYDFNCTETKRKRRLAKALKEDKKYNDEKVERNNPKTEEEIKKQKLLLKIKREKNMKLVKQKGRFIKLSSRSALTPIERRSKAVEELEKLGAKKARREVS